MQEAAAPESGGASSRQAAAEAHSRYLDGIAHELEAKFSQEKREAHIQFEEQKAQLRQEHTEKMAALRQQLEDKLIRQAADSKVQHAADRAEWESMLARRSSDSALFMYTVRGCEGPQLSGCVPRQIFQAEPDSALAHIYNGEWQYATDEQGRAVVNSNPAHWPLIMDWLSFGTVPSDPSPAFISECTYWQLNKLLDAVKPEGLAPAESSVVAAQAGSHHFEIKPICIDGNVGFILKGHILRFGQRYSLALDDKTSIRINFSALGRDWVLQLSQMVLRLRLLVGSPSTKEFVRFSFGDDAVKFCSSTKRLLSRDGDNTQASTRAVGFPTNEENGPKLRQPSILSLNGSMPITITMTMS